MFHFPAPINHIVLTLIVIELAIFLNQVVSYLSRPHEKSRLWHVILIGLLIVYNFAENLFLLPDPALPIPTVIQGIIGESTGYFVTAYIPFYAYKTMGFKYNRTLWHAKYGWLFVLIPTVFFFFILYPINKNLLLTRRCVFIIPGIYAITALYATGKWIFIEYKEEKNINSTRERLYIFLAVVFWCTQPLVGAFAGAPKWIVGLFSNINFLVLNTYFMLQLVRKSKNEYLQLQQSNKTLKDKVEERTRQIEKANEERTNTFVNLVHETKTPITLINNYIEEFINTHGHKNELTIVKRSIDKLYKDLSNLFDLERYNKGYIIYNHDQVANFSQILTDNFTLFLVYCKKKKLALHEKIEQNVFIKADPDAINAIVVNLIENAIKYTNTNGEITISLMADDEIIWFTVNDNGIGINEQLHDKIFEPYYQIKSLKGGFQGMGLGLPLVKKTVNDLNGQINIGHNPEKESGTRVTIALNRHIPIENELTVNYTVDNYSSLEVETLNVSDSEYNIHKKTILLVEDNLPMVNYLYKKLSADYNIVVAFNGIEALEKLKSYPVLPNLIISDVMMDNMDGFKFAKIISKNSTVNHIPFIFLSAKSSSADKLEGLKLGAIDFVQKPFSITELTQKIESLLENISNQRNVLISTAINALNRMGGYEIAQENDITKRREQNYKIYNLTLREIEIVELVRKAFTYKEIASSLFLSVSTVDKHIQNIFQKVDVTNKTLLLSKLDS